MTMGKTNPCFEKSERSKVSKRINLTVPDSVYEDLEIWSESQGRTIANLTAYLVEKALEDAKEQGKFPQPEQHQTKMN
jgi:hypothetical protein